MAIYNIADKCFLIIIVILKIHSSPTTDSGNGPIIPSLCYCLYCWQPLPQENATARGSTTICYNQ